MERKQDIKIVVIKSDLSRPYSFMAGEYVTTDTKHIDMRFFLHKVLYEKLSFKCVSAEENIPKEKLSKECGRTLNNRSISFR